MRFILEKPEAVTGLEVTRRDITALTVSWDANETADGYNIALFKPNTQKWAFYNVDAGTTTYKARNLTWSKKYTFKVRAFVMNGDEKIFGAYSEKVSANTKNAVATPKADGYCNLTDKPVVTWKKANKAKMYCIYRSVYKDKGFKKIATLDADARSYTDKKAKIHKTYYYRVRGWRKFNKKNAYSRPSETIKIKSKKTVFVGDSVMEGVKLYKGIPGGHFITKVGMGPYTFYENNYFTANGTKVTGVEKIISMKAEFGDFS